MFKVNLFIHKTMEIMLTPAVYAYTHAHDISGPG